MIYFPCELSTYKFPSVVEEYTNYSLQVNQCIIIQYNCLNYCVSENLSLLLLWHIFLLNVTNITLNFVQYLKHLCKCTIYNDIAQIILIKKKIKKIQTWLEPRTSALQSYVHVHLTNVLIGNGSLKRTIYCYIWDIIHLPALPIIVLCNWFLVVYVFHIIAFDLFQTN